jgi:putative component of membrane protein insertase Oxa1/YidC/SpoIIIJ protein YidD
MSPLARACIRLVELYQRGLGSRALLVECNFDPSCSAYMKEGQ